MFKKVNGVREPMSQEDIDNLAQARAPGRAQIVMERDRRLELGFDYDFGDERGVHHIGTTDRDMRGWDRVTKLKDALLQAGDTTSKIGISTNTGFVEVTAPEWNVLLLYYAANHEQPIWQASFALEAMDPIPSDYANDSYWP